MKVVKRSRGRTSVAAAAYCSGSKLKDRNLGETFNYLSKEGVVCSKILTPAGYPSWCLEREKLWNRVERAEKRRDAQVAREIIVALPRELNLKQQEELLTRFVEKSFTSQGMIVDFSIHHDNPDNPHAHILLTMRSIKNGDFDKKERHWNTKQFLKDVRTTWAKQTNLSLKEVGFSQISELSYSARGLSKKPTIHLGVKNHDALKHGVVMSRAKRNLEIKAENDSKKISYLRLFGAKNNTENRRSQNEIHETLVNEQFKSYGKKSK